MGLFNAYTNQVFEITEKQIILEYGEMLVDGETLEKAFRLGSDKWIFTSHRLLLVIACKGEKYELQSIPYSSIRKFSIITPGPSGRSCLLNIYLQDEPSPIKKAFKDSDLVRDINKIIARRIFNIGAQFNEIPILKLN